MYQLDAQSGTHIGNIQRESNIDVVSQFGFRFTFFDTGEAGSVNHNLRIFFSKYTDQIISRLKINFDDSNTCEVTICLYLRVLMMPSGTFLQGSSWSRGT